MPWLILKESAGDRLMQLQTTGWYTRVADAAADVCDICEVPVGQLFAIVTSMYRVRQKVIKRYPLGRVCKQVAAAPDHDGDKSSERLSLSCWVLAC